MPEAQISWGLSGPVFQNDSIHTVGVGSHNQSNCFSLVVVDEECVLVKKETFAKMLKTSAI